MVVIAIAVAGVRWDTHKKSDRKDVDKLRFMLTFVLADEIRKSV